MGKLKSNIKINNKYMEKVIAKLEAMYNKDEKSKNFVLHLVRAYMPVEKAIAAINKPEDLKKFKCALTDAKLMNTSEMLEILKSGEYQENYQQALEKELASNGSFKIKDHPIQSITNGRILGFAGKDTNTFLCFDAINALVKWTETRILAGDSKLGWTIRSMKPKNKPSDKKKVETNNQSYNINNKPASSKLGDIDVLQSLKAKLEKEESSNV